ncbi:MAG: PKD domain-containing protein [Candidatus Dormiibacterota bacterium]
MTSSPRRVNVAAAPARRRTWIACFPLGALLAGMLAFGGPVTRASAAGTSEWTAYVANLASNTVTPIDIATGATGASIAVGSEPEAIAITPNGKTAYVVNQRSDNVTPINTQTNIAGSPISVGSLPQGIAIAPDGKTAYVTNGFSNTVTPINIATNTTQPWIPVGQDPEGIAITPDGRTAYVANPGAHSVSPIDLATGSVGTAITVGGSPQNLAITPDGATLYVADGSGDAVTPVETATNVAGTPIALGANMNADDVAVSPNGATAYVTVGGGSVIPIHVATNTAGASIPVSDGVAAGISLTPDGKTAYVTSLNNIVTPIDTASNTAGTPITVGNESAGVAITPDQAPAANLSVLGSALGTATSFDASRSTVAYGSIASYAWNFGDGATAMTTTPTTTHTYPAVGLYTATVTETSTAGTSTTTVYTGQTMSQNGGPSARTSQVVTIIAPGAYTAVSPFRVCDTRALLPTNQCTGHTLGSDTSLHVQVTGKTGPIGQSVPADALAVALNVTALSESTTNSFISVFPAGEALPKVSNISLDAGATQANLVVVRLAAGGDVSVFNAVGRADVVVDVEGYFAPPGATPVAGEYHTMPPLRICDTRAGKGTECAGSFDNPLPANTWRDVVLSGRPSGAANNTPSIPTQSAAAAVFNLTAVNGTQATYVTVASPNLTTDACPTKPPAASNLNPPAGSALPNRVISALGPHQDVCVYNAVGSVDIIIDINGWFGDGTEGTTVPRGALFYSIPPARICDTRPTRNGSIANCQNQLIGPKSLLGIQVAGKSLVPDSGGPNPPIAVVANLTAVAGTATTFFTLFPADATLPLASDLNARAGDVVANLAFVTIATSQLGTGEVTLYNAAGSINAILDVAGWFQ